MAKGNFLRLFQAPGAIRIQPQFGLKNDRTMELMDSHQDFTREIQDFTGEIDDFMGKLRILLGKLRILLGKLKILLGKLIILWEN